MATAAAAMGPVRIGQQNTTRRRGGPDKGFVQIGHWEVSIASVYGNLAFHVWARMRSLENIANWDNPNRVEMKLDYSVEELATLCRCSTEAVRLVHRQLESDGLMVPAEPKFVKNARGNRQACLLIPAKALGLREAEDRPLKKLNRRPPGAGTRFTIPAGGRKSLRFQKAHEAVEMINPLEGSLDIDVEESESSVPILRPVIPVRIAEPDNAATTRKQDPTSNIASRVGMDNEPTDDPRLPELRDVLTPLMLRHCGKNPDDAYLGLILGEMGAATVVHYMGLAVKRCERARPGSIDSGLFLMIAGDAGRAAASKIRESAAPAPGAAVSRVKPPAFVAEPEDADTPWSRIRSKLKPKMVQQDYENWLRSTSFESYDPPVKWGKLAEPGVLSIRVPDQASADFIAQECRGRILAEARNIGLDVSVLRCTT